MFVDINSIDYLDARWFEGCYSINKKHPIFGTYHIIEWSRLNDMINHFFGEGW